MKVLRKFRDKYNPAKIYMPGEQFDCNDPERMKDLANMGLVEGAPAPFANLTKREIMDLLTERGIEFSARQPKAELAALLGGE